MRLRSSLAMLFGAGLLIGPMLATEPEASAESNAAPRAHLTVSRVDVRQHPTVAAVVTVPPGVGTDDVRAGLSIRSGDSRLTGTVTPLSAQDIELVLVPDTQLPEDLLAEERSALTQLVMQLPQGSRTTMMRPGAIVSVRGTSPATPPSANPAGTLRSLSALSRAPTVGTAAQRVESAMAALSTGPTVRRTVVLVASGHDDEPEGMIDHLRRRLVASGTQLFVLDLEARSPVTSLATPSGGSALHATAQHGAFAGLASRATGIAATLKNQYYVQFHDPRPLPHRVHARLRLTGRHAGSGAGGAGGANAPTGRSGGHTPTGLWLADVDLPQSNPTAPGPWVVPPDLAPVPPPVLRTDTVLALLAVLLVLLNLLYGIGMLTASRREPRCRVKGPRAGQGRDAAAQAAAGTVVGQGSGSPEGSTTDKDLFFVFLLPCLNEERVIGASVQRLLSFPDDNFGVMVIDDGSDDDTAAIVESLGHERVWLFRRRPPNARKGKGEALNAAVTELVNHHLTGHDSDRVILVVVDADGRVDPETIAAVTPLFHDPVVGAVQTGVRINNRHTSRLARMQDMEFVIYTHVFQRGRRHLGSVGLGGNGQFMRLSALLSLGPTPWSRSLTEDLDLGVRLLAGGWRNEYCSSVAVYQQGVVELRKLIRQRSRWFQGHLQSWRLLGLVVREVPGAARLDLIYHLSSPALLLIASMLTASFLAGLADCALMAIQGTNPFTWWSVSSYLLAFGPALAYIQVYRRTERDLAPLGWWQILLLAHQYVFYGLMWYAAGWIAVWRSLRGHTSWAKTDRVAEATPDETATPDGTELTAGQITTQVTS